MLKLVIPAAGLGSRIGPYTKFKNKGLLTVGQKPAISHVIDTFSRISDLVIILGYQGGALRDAIVTLHPDKNITFVIVDKFTGPGSGLGYSLNTAKEYLQCPFVFCPNDAIFSAFPENEFLSPISGNLLGYYRKQPHDDYRLEDFRTIELHDGMVGRIFPKGSGSSLIYTGVARIEDYYEFWSGMESDLAVEAGEVIGLSALPRLRGIEISSWHDCGTLENLERSRSQFCSKDFIVLEKQDEAIWFKGDRVVKFSSNPKFIYGRLMRHKRLPINLVPQISDSTDYTYSYQLIPGTTFDPFRHSGRLIGILDTMQKEIWSEYNDTDPEPLYAIAISFYKEKTLARCREYQARYEDFDDSLMINGVQVSALNEQLSLLNWDELACNCVWANYHGDFHPDNIIVGEETFTLIDWRQDFGRDFYDCGDVYYDLAKFLHGLEINHKIISDQGFRVHWMDKRDVRIDVFQRMSLLDIKQEFINWLLSNNYSLHRVYLLTSLIYLNIASLHEYPYAQFLYLLGRLKLQRYLVPS